MSISGLKINTRNFPKGDSNAVIEYTVAVERHCIATVEITLSPCPPLRVMGSSVLRKTYTLKKGTCNLKEEVTITNSNTKPIGGVAFVFAKLKMSGVKYSTTDSVELTYS